MCLVFLIVATTTAAPIEGHYPSAKEIFFAKFAETDDRDYDGWPDHWTRRQGPGFPRFNKIRLTSEKTPSGGTALEMVLDGGGTVACSPRLPVSVLYDYVLEADIKTPRLENDCTYLSLSILDEKGRTVETYFSPKLRRTENWTRLRLGPVSPMTPSTHTAAIGLHVEPLAKADIHATVLFSNIWLGRLPRMSLVTDNPSRIYRDPAQATVTATITGLPDPDGKMAFELTDVLGATIARETKPLDITTVTAKSPDSKTPAKDQTVGRIGSATWSPPALGLGYYQLRAELVGHDSDALRRDAALVVLRPKHNSTGGEFGWSLSHDDRQRPLPELSSLLIQSGIHWVKYPLWLDRTAAPSLVPPLLTFLEEMSLHGIEVVGVLDQPPDELLARFDAARTPSAADVFNARPDVWSPTLQGVMKQLGTRVRWWQLGGDADLSFIGYPELGPKIAQVKSELDRLGFDLNIGFGWNWQVPPPDLTPAKLPWRFLNLSADPPLTAAELGDYLPAMKRDQARRWVLIEPLERGQYSLEDRTRDLVARMLAAKACGAEGIFAHDPFNSRRGLMSDDGTPAELFLPWRTTALFLGGAEPLGPIYLPRGSSNYVFLRNQDAMMVVWNREPTQETLYLGEEVLQVDLWGRETVPQKTPEGHRIQVGRLPTFVVGLNRGVTQLRYSFTLASDQFPSISGQKLPNSLGFTNTLDQAIKGILTLASPTAWDFQPKQINFRVAPGEKFRQRLETSLPGSAPSGAELLRADFELKSERGLRFSTYYPVKVGTPGLRVEFTSQLDGRGMLEVQQWTTNENDAPIDLRCQLFAPGRQRQLTKIMGLRRGQDITTYRFPDGKPLIGKTLWLQAEDLNGPQVFNYRFVVEP